MDSSINKGMVLSFAKEALKHSPEDDYSGLMAATLKLMAEAGLIEKESDGQYHNTHLRLTYGKSPLSSIIVEAYQYLLTVGYIIPKPNPPNYPEPTFYVLTELGKEWIETGDPVVEDVDGFLAILSGQIPSLDSAIKQYISEALIAFDRGAIFATAVMIGAASEKAIYILINAIFLSTKDEKTKKEIGEAIERRGMPALFVLITRGLDQVKDKKMPYSVYEGADRHLLSLADSIRVQRNDAVHPVAGKVDRSSVRLSLQSFPYACKKVYDLITWFSENKID